MASACTPVPSKVNRSESCRVNSFSTSLRVKFLRNRFSRVLQFLQQFWRNSEEVDSGECLDLSNLSKGMLRV